ncbi:transporter substrate-binding domain-containing protein [Spirillospora sp. NPDC050679]
MLGAAALILVAAAGCPDESKSKPKREPSILKPGANVHVGLLTDLPGWSDFNADSHVWAGFQYDLMNRLGFNLKLTPTPVTVSFEDRLRRLQNGEVGILLANFSMTDERCEQVLCIGPYMISENSVLTRSDGPRITKTAEMRKKTVCSMTGTTSLQKLNEQLGGSISIVQKVGLRQCVQELKAAKVDAVSTAEVDLLGFAQNDRSLRLEDFHFGTQDRFAIALRKNASIQDCQTVRAQLQAFLASPEWGQFFGQHFPKEPPASHKPDLNAIQACPTK